MKGYLRCCMCDEVIRVIDDSEYTELVNVGNENRFCGNCLKQLEAIEKL